MDSVLLTVPGGSNGGAAIPQSACGSFQGTLESVTNAFGSVGRFLLGTVEAIEQFMRKLIFADQATCDFAKELREAKSVPANGAQATSAADATSAQSAIRQSQTTSRPGLKNTFLARADLCSILEKLAAQIESHDPGLASQMRAVKTSLGASTPLTIDQWGDVSYQFQAFEIAWQNVCDKQIGDFSGAAGQELKTLEQEFRKQQQLLDAYNNVKTAAEVAVRKTRPNLPKAEFATEVAVYPGVSAARQAFLAGLKKYSAQEFEQHRKLFRAYDSARAVAKREIEENSSQLTEAELNQKIEKNPKVIEAKKKLEEIAQSNCQAKLRLQQTVLQHIKDLEFRSRFAWESLAHAAIAARLKDIYDAKWNSGYSRTRSWSASFSAGLGLLYEGACEVGLTVETSAENLVMEMMDDENYPGLLKLTNGILSAKLGVDVLAGLFAAFLEGRTSATLPPSRCGVYREWNNSEDHAVEQFTRLVQNCLDDPVVKKYSSRRNTLECKSDFILDWRSKAEVKKIDESVEQNRINAAAVKKRLDVLCDSISSEESDKVIALLKKENAALLAQAKLRDGRSEMEKVAIKIANDPRFQAEMREIDNSVQKNWAAYDEEITQRLETEALNRSMSSERAKQAKALQLREQEAQNEVTSATNGVIQARKAINSTKTGGFFDEEMGRQFNPEAFNLPLSQEVEVLEASQRERENQAELAAAEERLKVANQNLAQAKQAKETFKDGRISPEDEKKAKALLNPENAAQLQEAKCKVQRAELRKEYNALLNEEDLSTLTKVTSQLVKRKEEARSDVRAMEAKKQALENKKKNLEEQKTALEQQEKKLGQEKTGLQNQGNATNTDETRFYSSISDAADEAETLQPNFKNGLTDTERHTERQLNDLFRVITGLSKYITQVSCEITALSANINTANANILKWDKELNELPVVQARRGAAAEKLTQQHPFLLRQEKSEDRVDQAEQIAVNITNSSSFGAKMAEIGGSITKSKATQNQIINRWLDSEFANGVSEHKKTQAAKLLMKENAVELDKARVKDKRTEIEKLAIKIEAEQTSLAACYSTQGQLDEKQMAAVIQKTDKENSNRGTVQQIEIPEVNPFKTRADKTSKSATVYAGLGIKEFFEKVFSVDVPDILSSLSQSCFVTVKRERVVLKADPLAMVGKFLCNDLVSEEEKKIFIDQMEEQCSQFSAGLANAWGMAATRSELTDKGKEMLQVFGMVSDKERLKEYFKNNPKLNPGISGQQAFGEYLDRARLHPELLRLFELEGGRRNALLKTYGLIKTQAQPSIGVEKTSSEKQQNPLSAYDVKTQLLHLRTDFDLYSNTYQHITELQKALESEKNEALRQPIEAQINKNRLFCKLIEQRWGAAGSQGNLEIERYTAAQRNIANLRRQLQKIEWTKETGQEIRQLEKEIKKNEEICKDIQRAWSKTDGEHLLHNMLAFNAKLLNQVRNDPAQEKLKIELLSFEEKSLMCPRFLEQDKEELGWRGRLQIRNKVDFEVRDWEISFKATVGLLGAGLDRSVTIRFRERIHTNLLRDVDFLDVSLGLGVSVGGALFTQLNSVLEATGGAFNSPDMAALGPAIQAMVSSSDSIYGMDMEGSVGAGLVVQRRSYKPRDVVDAEYKPIWTRVIQNGQAAFGVGNAISLVGRGLKLLTGTASAGMIKFGFQRTQSQSDLLLQTNTGESLNDYLLHYMHGPNDKFRYWNKMKIEQTAGFRELFLNEKIEKEIEDDQKSVQANKYLNDDKKKKFEAAAQEFLKQMKAFREGTGGSYRTCLDAFEGYAQAFEPHWSVSKQTSARRQGYSMFTRSVNGSAVEYTITEKAAAKVDADTATVNTPPMLPAIPVLSSLAPEPEKNESSASQQPIPNNFPETAVAPPPDAFMLPRAEKPQAESDSASIWDDLEAYVPVDRDEEEKALRRLAAQQLLPPSSPDRDRNKRMAASQTPLGRIRSFTEDSFTVPPESPSSSGKSSLTNSNSGSPERFISRNPSNVWPEELLASSSSLFSSTNPGTSQMSLSSSSSSSSSSSTSSSLMSSFTALPETSPGSKFPSTYSQPVNRKLELDSSAAVPLFSFGPNQAATAAPAVRANGTFHSAVNSFGNSRPNNPLTFSGRFPFDAEPISSQQ